MKLPNIDPRKFYAMGTFLFFVSILGNLWSLTLTWSAQNIGSRASSIAMLLFQFLLMMFFYNMYITTPIITKDQQKEIDSLIDQYQNS